jgi:hypothetical protein
MSTSNPAPYNFPPTSSIPLPHNVASQQPQSGSHPQYQHPFPPQYWPPQYYPPQQYPPNMPTNLPPGQLPYHPYYPVPLMKHLPGTNPHAPQFPPTQPLHPVPQPQSQNENQPQPSSQVEGEAEGQGESFVGRKISLVRVSDQCKFIGTIIELDTEKSLLTLADATIVARKGVDLTSPENVGKITLQQDNIDDINIIGDDAEAVAAMVNETAEELPILVS